MILNAGDLWLPHILQDVIQILLDIHSHILPGVDDGAKNTEESLELLRMMKNQGITDVIATPHFYAMSENLENYQKKISAAYNILTEAIKGADMPRIYIGSEVLYYRYIGKSDSVFNFCLNNSNYLLLELSDNSIGSELFDDINELRGNLGITPIIAHLERYYKFYGYKKLLKFISENGILAQVNASSLFSQGYSKIAEKLIKNQLVSFIGTDAHSPDKRPPMMKQALEVIAKKIGTEYASGFIRNSQTLLEQIG